MENYADVLESYVIVEEGFGDIVKKAGKGIWNALLALIKKVKEFITNIFGKLNKNAKKIDELQKKNQDLETHNARLREENTQLKQESENNAIVVRSMKACRQLTRQTAEVNKLLIEMTRHNQLFYKFLNSKNYHERWSEDEENSLYNTKELFDKIERVDYIDNFEELTSNINWDSLHNDERRSMYSTLKSCLEVAMKVLNDCEKALEHMPLYRKESHEELGPMYKQGAADRTLAKFHTNLQKEVTFIQSYAKAINEFIS